MIIAWLINFLFSMDKWLQFFADQGVRIDEATSQTELASSDPAAMPEGFVAPLTDLGLIAFTGEDATHFLHNQLTNDVEHLSAEEARLAGYCTPKGRLLATLLMWKNADAIVLLMPRQILPAIQKRLGMYVLRAKVKVADITGDSALLGIGGSLAADALKTHFADLPGTPYAKIETEGGTLIRVADATGLPRYLWIAAAERAIAAWPSLTAKLKALGTSAWRLTDIQAALPQIVLETQDKFVPQMINFEVVGGVNFKKGCYPGQEIVARSQYLGKLKRRMMPALVDGDAAAGMDVFSEADPEQPCGMIVNAERSGRQSAVLVELKTAELGSPIHLGSISGPTLAMQVLPYDLPDAG